MKGREAELAFRKWLQAHGWVVHLAAATGRHKLPNGRYVVQSHDLFGALDILAFRENDTWGIQISTLKGATARRRKVESVTWPLCWHVSLAVMADEKSGATGRTRKVWRVQDWKNDPTAQEDLAGHPRGSWQEAVALDPKHGEPLWSLAIAPGKLEPIALMGNQKP